MLKARKDSSVCVCLCGSACPVEFLPNETRSRFQRGEAYSSGVAVHIKIGLSSNLAAQTSHAKSTPAKMAIIILTFCN